MKLQFYGASDVGRKRDLNEDSFIVSEKAGFILVCDGMGGHAAGEVASRIAVETIETIFQLDQNRIQSVLSEIDDSFPETAKKLNTAIRMANRRIYRMALQNPTQTGMGTTVVSLAVTLDGLACIAHVGDSRAYRIRRGEIEPLTVDHSFIAELVQDRELTKEEAKSIGPKNVITRALGTKYAVKVDLRIEPMEEGDIYLLCSDGLSGQVEDEEIRKTLIETNGDLKLASERLIQKANDSGGPDNITVALLHAIEIPGVSPQRSSLLPLTLPEETSILQEAEDALLDRLYEKPQKVRKRRILPMIIIAGILIFITGIGLLLSSKSRNNSPQKSPPPSFATVEVKTSPEGATLFIDGSPFPEKTPTRIPNLQVGSLHELRVERSGYLPENVNVKIPLEGLSKTIDLKPEVVVHLTYWEERYDETTLYIDGNSVGKLSELKGKSLPLSVGIHTFEIRDREGRVHFEKRNQSVTLGNTISIVPDERDPELQFTIE